MGTLQGYGQGSVQIVFKFKKVEPEMANAHIKPEIRALVERTEPVSKAEWEALRMNSYEQELLIPHLDDEAIGAYADVVLANCSYDRKRPFVGYNDAAMGLLAPELLRRLRDKQDAHKRASGPPAQVGAGDVLLRGGGSSGAFELYPKDRRDEAHDIFVDWWMQDYFHAEEWRPFTDRTDEVLIEIRDHGASNEASLRDVMSGRV